MAPCCNRSFLGIEQRSARNNELLFPCCVSVAESLDARGALLDMCRAYGCRRDASVEHLLVVVGSVAGQLPLVAPG